MRKDRKVGWYGQRRKNLRNKKRERKEACWQKEEMRKERQKGRMK